MEKITSNLKLTIYNKGGATWFCDYYFYNGINHEHGTTKASGWGYDKHSTATSNAINKFCFLYNFKKGIKWDGCEHLQLKNGHRVYGVYKDKDISYGIGLSSVLNCLTAFSNIKVVNVHYGKNEDFIHIQIKNTQKQLENEILKNQKKIDNKKTDKDERKRLKAVNIKIQELFNI